MNVPIQFGGQGVVFFGNAITSDCQRCGAYAATDTGHKYCVHVTCPIALREFKRRKRRRTSTLEQTYIPQVAARREAARLVADEAAKARS